MKTISVVHDVLNRVDSTSIGMVVNVYAWITITMIGFVTKLLLISISIFGISMMFGWIQYPVRDFLKKMILYSFVLTFFFRWGFFYTYIYLFFYESFESMGGLILSATGGGLFPASIADSLNNVMEQGVAAANKGLEAGGRFLKYIIWLLIYLSVFVFVIYALALIVISKIAMTALLAVTPIFLLFTLFDITRGMFSAWLKQMFTYGFLAMIVYLMMAFFMVLLENSIAHILALTDFGVGELTPLVVVGFLGVIVLMQAPQIASGLGSGAQLTTLGAIGELRRSTTRNGIKAAGYLKQKFQSRKSRRNSNTIKRK